MALLTIQSIDKAGLEIVAALAAAASGGDTVKATAGGIFIAVDNTSGSSRTVTVVSPVATKDCGGFGQVDIDDITIALADGELRLFKIPSGYGDSNGDFPLTYDDEAGLAVGVFSIAS